jgi:DNA processing protein
MRLPETTLGLLALWLLPGLGPKRIKKLWDHFGSIKPIFDAKPSHLTELLGSNFQMAQEIPHALDSDRLKSELHLIETHSVNIIDFTDAEYPSALKEIHNAPPILYTKGKYNLNQGFFLAFVGSRKASFAGQNMCKKLITKIAVLRPNVVIVSGLALGIDTSAHRAALDSGLMTIAVLANGLSDVYPARNSSLAASIQQNGLLVTEFPMSSKPMAINFPLRNRIISGLSKGVVIVEAGERSGATITAGYALEQNRELFALPGPADSKFYRGTNTLIQRSQAKLVMDAEDILEEFFPINRQLTHDEVTRKADSEKEELSTEELKVLDLIKIGIVQKDTLIEKAELSIQRLLSLLTSLEIKGYIVSKPGAVYEAAD